MEMLSPSKDIADIVRELGGEKSQLCYQCGTCTGSCPWNRVHLFSPRRMIHQAQLGLSEFESDDVWRCVTCNTCVERCPRGVPIIDVMRSLRRIISSVGLAEVPDALNATLKNIFSTGNPLGEAPEKRSEWAAKMRVKTFTPSTEVLFFSCCISAYDPKVRRMSQAAVKLLTRANVDFGILDGSENCCGESVRKIGNEDLFQRLASHNIELFKAQGVKKIVVNSPHCYSTFKDDYPALGGEFEVMHITQFLAWLIEQSALKPGPLFKKVTYHDPCYLGRHSGIYDDPRKIIASIPGVEFTELIESRQDSFCCGGGGGRIWMETKKEERFADLRLNQVESVAAEALVTSCPYCISNFDDSVLNAGSAIEIIDIAELLAQAIEGKDS